MNEQCLNDFLSALVSSALIVHFKQKGFNIYDFQLVLLFRALCLILQSVFCFSSFGFSETIPLVLRIVYASLTLGDVCRIHEWPATQCLARSPPGHHLLTRSSSIALVCSLHQRMTNHSFTTHFELTHQQQQQSNNIKHTPKIDCLSGVILERWMPIRQCVAEAAPLKCNENSIQI